MVLASLELFKILISIVFPSITAPLKLNAPSFGTPNGSTVSVLSATGIVASIPPNTAASAN
jgi:hypothetical protein